MSDESLRVHPERLAQAGAQLTSHAGEIPVIPPAAPVSGSDPLSSAIAAKAKALEQPVTGL